MKITHTVINNFRPFYSENRIDLTTTQDKNIILIGGLNGHGKSSLLLSMLWCLYGKRIYEVDYKYRKEIGRNYNHFVVNSLNWQAHKEGQRAIKVELEFQDVELTELFTSVEQQTTNVNIIRIHNIDTGEEELNILIGGVKNELIKEEAHKNQFIDEFLIPLEAAKFIFFDAEQISDLADMGIKEQGGILNDALGKILGLDVYEKLLKDIQFTKNELKRMSASDVLLVQIESLQNKKKIKNEQLKEDLDNHDELEEKLNEIEKKITEFRENLLKHGAPHEGLNVEIYSKKLKELEEQKVGILDQLNELLEFIPFTILANNLQELVEQIGLEEERKFAKKDEDILSDRIIDLAGKVFYEPEFPKEDISYSQKKFYSEKVEKLLGDFFLKSSESDIGEISIYHDLSKSDTDFIHDIFNQVKYTSKERYEQLYNDDIRINNEINEIKKVIHDAETKLEDEIIAEWREKLKYAEKERDSLHRKIGEIENRIKIDESELERLDVQLDNIYDKVEVSKANKSKIEKINKYINALTEFIDKQKRSKCQNLSKRATEEINKIMHTQKINKIELGLLPENKGLIVKIFDNMNTEIPQNLLSNGEKQLFISTIFKSIVSLSIKEFPMIIDTPLARMDEEHRENILFKYYPNLSSQVIIFPTNSEISRSKRGKLSAFIANEYTLINRDGKSVIRKGYF
ncbi:MAG: DNA sulfur modification protein DndD [Candidatus Lokiarchaeota archaeon]|nr:DNA sulfur modification protein DndD [Candidatus Lokiarchaeota archaeon]